jgi:serine/threonine protein kinase
MKPGGAPRLVGRYALFDAIASGGMATVHFGRLLGPAGFSRTVAIKRLHESFASDPEFVAMFMDEARLAARVRHPNVVPTLDVVALDHELLLVMEYVAGESLAHLLKAARVSGKQAPIPVVVDILIQALSGLHAAHEAVDEAGQPLDIVHRDVSPQNILVGTDGVARVLDFGVAKAIGRSQETREGQVKGKLRYMAPEQIRGKDVTRAADIYAASIVLWEALTGHRLFEGENDIAVMYQVIEGRPEPPSGIRPEISRALDAIVVRGLSPRAGDRYATALEMASALEGVIPALARSTVAAWVQENAHDSLQRRKERLARVESTGSRAAEPGLSSSPSVRALVPGHEERRESSEVVSSLTPPSVERSARSSFLADGLGWGGKRALLAGAAATLFVGLVPLLLSHRTSLPATAGAPGAPPPATAIATAPIMPVPATDIVAAPVRAAADAGSEARAQEGSTGAPSGVPPIRKRPPSAPAARAAAPRSAPTERLYQRD